MTDTPSTPSLSPPEAAPTRAFTVKSLLFSLLAVLLVVAGAMYNDAVLKQTYIVGNHLPIVVVCILLALVTVWNPLCILLKLRRLALSAAELAVVLSASLVACWVPSSGFYRYFHKLLIFPWIEAGRNPSWAPAMSTLPRDLFPLGVPASDSVEFERVYAGLRQGISGEQVTLWSWPWQDWLDPVAKWAPLILCFAVASLALALVVQRQWARHEQLSYPLATIFNGFIDRRERGGARAWPDVFYSPMFLAAGVAVLLFHGHNMVNLWFPEWPEPIPRQFVMGWSTLVPTLGKSGGWNAETGKLYFTVLGVAYFLAGEISFTLGISQLLLAFGLSMQFYLATGRPMNTEDIDLLRFGAYVGYAGILIYAGRTWYWHILLKALGRGRPQVHEAESVWAARAFLLSFAGMTISLWWLGVPFFAGAALAAVVMLFLLVFTRIICETGIPFLQMVRGNNLVHYMMRLTGFGFWGPKTVVFFYFLASMLLQDPRECLMPYGATALKVGEDQGVRGKRLFLWSVGAVVLALTFGFVFNGWLLYSKGHGMHDSWASTYVPREIFSNSTRALNEIRRAGEATYDLSENGGLVDRLGLLSPTPGALTWAVVGAVLVVAFSTARFRWTWWPLHPVLFLVWGTMPLGNFWASFLIGWLVKTLIVHFGGGKVYQRFKPLFLGLIGGELAAAGAGIMIGFVYFFVTHQSPRSYLMFPG